LANLNCKVQISTDFLWQLKSFGSHANRDALAVSATLHDHVSTTKTANPEARTHLMELFSLMNAGFFTELKTIISNEATARHQDQVGFRAGLAELRTLQTQAAENTGRLFDYQ
jgi:hypothetical protein